MTNNLSCSKVIINVVETYEKYTRRTTEMERRFLVLEKGILVFSKDEASLEAEGTPIIAGTFKETTSTWTGTFTADDGRTYEIIDGYILKEAV